MIDPSEASGYPQVGEIVDEKYRVERLLGAGGMGAVVEATHLLRRAPVALKFMSARLVHDPAVVERFLNEGVAASRISNEHVVSVLDVSKLASGQPYLVMEYLEGRDLAKLLATEGAPGLADVPRSVHFVLQVLRGLQVAHAAGIIHRDLKPANCLVVERDGEPDFLKIVDFGISKVKSDPLNLTKVGSALGTPLYVSPEQARDPASVDARGDLYSVATILYELLAGRTPFHPESGQLSELFMALATLEPPSLERVRGDLPPGLDGAIRVGLAKSPDGRYRSAAEMAAALAPFADVRSERVLRQLLQRTTLRPFGSSPPSPQGSSQSPYGSAPPSPYGSAPPYGSSPQSPYASSPPVPPSAPPLLRTGPGSAGAPTERAPTPPPASYRPGFSAPASPPVSGGPRSAYSAPSPPTEKLAASSPSGAPVGWTAVPSDTAAPTTQAPFLQRRQTEIKIAVPVLAALVLAALLFRTLRSSQLASDAGGIAPAATSIATDVQLAPPAAAPPAVTPPAGTQPAPVPAVRVVPGGSAPPVGGPAPGSALPAPAPGATSPAANTPAPTVTPVPSTAPADGRDSARSGPRPKQSSAPPSSSGGKQRRPSLKQIGISE